MKKFLTSTLGLMAVVVFMLNACTASEQNKTAQESESTAVEQKKGMDKNSPPMAAKTKVKVVEDKKEQESDEKPAEFAAKEKEKGVDANVKTAYDFPHFMKFDLKDWTKVFSEESEEGDSWGTLYRYQKDGQTLEFNDGISSYGYFQDYKLIDADNKVLKKRGFYYSDGFMSETVMDYTTNPFQEFTREEERRIAYEMWNSAEKPLMASGEWTKTGGESANKAISNPAISQLAESAAQWGNLDVNYEPNRERDDTWLREGFRAKYAMLKKFASLSMIEKAFGVPVFVKGPHDGEMNFNDNASFGYYNPAFIAKLSATIEGAMENEVTKKVLREVYYRNLESMARTYHESYLYVNDFGIEGLQKQYKNSLGSGEGSMQEIFRDFADNGYHGDAADAEASQLKNPQRNWYEAVTAPAFWVRRSLDGTDKELFKLLDTVIKEIDK